MFFTAAGGSVTKSSSQPPAYLRIKEARAVRDSKGVTVSYTLAGNAPELGSEADATYWTWLGDGLDDMDEPAVSMQYLDSRWFVQVSGTNDVVGGDVEARPEIHGRTVSVRLPLRVPTSSGYVADLSKFTHAGWSTAGKDPRDSALGWMVARSVGRKPATRDRGKWHCTELAAGVWWAVSACCPVEPIPEYREATSEPRDAGTGRGSGMISRFPQGRASPR